MLGNPLDFSFSDFRRARRQGWQYIYVYPDGRLSLDPMVGISSMFSNPSLQILHGEKILRVQWLDPTSSLFANAVYDLLPYIPDLLNWNLEIIGASHASAAHKPGKYYRQVRYWMGLPRTDTGELPPYLYHGTSSELWYDNIRNEGLRVRSEGHIGSFGSYGASGALSLPDRIYLSAHPDLAARAAAWQAASAHGGWPTIIRIDTRYLDALLLGEDEDADIIKLAKTYQELGLPIPPAAVLSLRFMGTVSYQGNIPSEALKPLTRNAEVYQHQGGKWIPWDNPPRQEHPLTRRLAAGDLIGLNQVAFYALYYAGILDQDSNFTGLDFNDQMIRHILKNSQWAVMAGELTKQINSWGMNGIKSLQYYPVQVLEPELQQIIDLLLEHGIYFVQNSKTWDLQDDGTRVSLPIQYLTYNSNFSYNPVPKIVALAVAMHDLGIDVKTLLERIEVIRNKYQRM